MSKPNPKASSKLSPEDEAALRRFEERRNQPIKPMGPLLRKLGYDLDALISERRRKRAR